MSAKRCRAFLLAAIAAAALARAGAAAPETLEITAFTTPFRTLEIASETRGILTEVHVEEGQPVRQGDILVELKADVLRAQLAVNEARVASAELRVEAARFTFQTRTSEYERIRGLHAEDVVAVDEHDRAKLEMDLAKLSVENASAEKLVHELNVARDKALIEQMLIRAPMDGLIHRVLKRPGEAAEENRPVLVMVAIDPLFVIAYAPIRAGGRVEAGMEATLYLEEAPETPLACTVSVADRVGDAASGTYRVKLLLPNPERAITAGAKGRLVFVLDTPADVSKDLVERKDHGEG